jgi:hypothetical protein
VTVVLVALCDHQVLYGTCPNRTLPARSTDVVAAWQLWEREGWVQTGGGRVLCPDHSGRRR